MGPNWLCEWKKDTREWKHNTTLFFLFIYKTVLSLTLYQREDSDQKDSPFISWFLIHYVPIQESNKMSVCFEGENEKTEDEDKKERKEVVVPEKIHLQIMVL